jgi:hypothetical protein
LSTDGDVIVLGMGEIGQPLFRILSRTFECVPVDLEPVDSNRKCSVLHICYPFQIVDFIGTTAAYVAKYKPALTIVNSTVAPGVTRDIQQRCKATLVAYSPVRGKHARMEADMLRYNKFVAASSPEAVRQATLHLREAGFTTDTFSTPEAAELAKLLETTYLGVLVAWAQEVERIAGHYGSFYDEVNQFIKEIDFLPSHIFPGVIRGHCVMPNIEILRNCFASAFLDVVIESNDRKKDTELVSSTREFR